MDFSMDPIEAHWRMNSSFSPPLSRRWDLRLQPDESPHESRDAPTVGSSLSSNSKESGRRMNNDQYSNHYHSVSDGVLSYVGSPSNTFKVPRWMPPVQRFDMGEFATPARGARPEASPLSHSNERSLAAGVSSVPYSIESGSPFSESGIWGSTSKGPFPSRHSSSRRSFMSKPVYPLVFHNPVSDNEACGIGESSGGRLPPTTPNCKAPFEWPDSDSSPELKFHKSISELQRMEASPEPNSSSRRQGFRWSNASSYDFGYEDGVSIPESIGMDSMRSPISTDQKCGLCKRLLCQKSPWSSCRIVRNGDMPIAGVLPCSHVFHADCLEEMTPKMQIHDPPCPTCVGAVNIPESISFSEPLQVALRAARKKHDNAINEDAPMDSHLESDGNLKRNQSLPMLRRGGSSSIKHHIKKHFPFKASLGKDIFAANILRRKASSLSFGNKQIGRLKTGQCSNQLQ